MNASPIRGERKTQLARAARIILVGAPGVGKGTQAERLMKRFPQLAAISSGDLLRQNVCTRTPLGIRAESVMKAGALVSAGPASSPMTLSSTAVGASMMPEAADNFISADMDAASSMPVQASDDPSASFILDGFPRTAAQAAQLDSQITINLVVNIITPTSIILDRISDRLVHAPSGRVYNDTFNPPRVAGRDDVTGEPLTRRADDDPQTWMNRLRKFEQTSRPLLEHYRHRDMLWTVEGNSSDEISPVLFEEFERRFVGGRY
ncbi:MAG: hypothetical protein M1816_006087 [Peltula sp. TS41687]|nr:MAG: hypothetical protein M1816_006087 [Peltula sp. TS41687]